MLFREVPLLDRPGAAKAAGFDAVEFWWPFDVAVPANRDIDDFCAAITDAAVHLVGLNFFAGDLAGADCGIVSLPGRAQEFHDNIGVVMSIGSRLGVEVYNALYGVPLPTSSPEEQDSCAVTNLVAAANAAATVGGTVVVEAVSGPKAYPLRTAADAITVVEAVRGRGEQAIEWLLDVYHLAANGDDIEAAVALHADEIAHVQVADWPGRGEPGSGSLDVAHLLETIAQQGFPGHVGLEYAPTTSTGASLSWLGRDERSVPRRASGDPAARRTQ